MDNPVAIQRLVLVGLLASPLLAALVCAWIGHSSNKGVRGFARLFALLHLGLTSLLSFTCAVDFQDRGTVQGNAKFLAAQTFRPTIVPGDPGIKGNPDTQAHYTSWDLFSVQTLSESMQKIEEATAIQFFIGLDGLNIWLVWLTSFLTVIAIFVSDRNIQERIGAFHAWLFVLQSMIIGAFTAFDIVLFYVFFELTLIPTFFLIGQWGVGGSRRDAARKFFLYTLFGSLLTLTGAIGIVVTNPVPVYSNGITMTTLPQPGVDQKVATPQRGPISFSIPVLIKNMRVWVEVQEWKVRTSQSVVDAQKNKLETAEKQAGADRSNAAKRQAADQAKEELGKVEAAHSKVVAERRNSLDYQTIFFFLLMAGFAVKIPIVPFHTWLPGAYGEAPIGVTLLLSGVMAKLGTYGIIRIVLPLTPDAAIAYGLPVFGTLGAIGIVYAAFCAYSQRDIKLLTVYSSISHLGLVVLGLFTLNSEGLTGAALHMVNHGISTGAMFALLAFLIDRHRTTDSTVYGGLMGKYPSYAALMIVVCLAGVGMPGLNNFVSEMMMLAGLSTPTSRVNVGYWLFVAAATGIFLSAWYTFTMIRRVFFGPESSPATVEGTSPGLTSTEWVGFGAPAVLCLALGLYPQPIIECMNYDVAVVSRLADEARTRAGLQLDPEKERIPDPPTGAVSPDTPPAPKGMNMGGAPGGGAKAGKGAKGGDKGKKGAAPVVPPPPPAPNPEVAPMPKSKQ
jgi:NADH-quinone oxidoreductase subunit M